MAKRQEPRAANVMGDPLPPGEPGDPSSYDMEINVADQNELDDFLASALPDVPEVPTETPTTAPEADPFSRDPDTGRFAPKAGDPQPEPQPSPTPSEPVAKPAASHPTVPVDVVTAMRNENRELRQHLLSMQQQMAGLQKPAPTEPKRDVWEDPNGFVDERIQPVRDAVDQQTLRFSKMLAMQTHGRDAVQQAYDSLGEVMQSNPAARFEYQRIMSSEHPYDELVQWHKRHQTLSKIGDNPDAYVEAELERRMADPQFQAKMLERIRGAAAQSATPTVAIPPSLSRVPTGANSAPSADLSDAGLFAHATAGMR